MKPQTANRSVSFTIDTVKFTVDIDGSYYTEKEEDSLNSGLHYHPKFEIYFIFDDPLILRSETGSAELSDCIAIIPPFYKHRTRRKAVYRLLLSFENRGGGSEFSKFFDKLLSETSPTLIINRKEEMAVYLRELAYVIESSTCVNNEITEATLKLILFHLFIFKVGISDRGVASQSTKSNTMIIEETLNLYAQDPSVDLNLTFMSKRLCLGKKQTARIIYSNYKKTLSELVNERRLAIACDLILHTSLSITEIAVRANFHSENHFYSSFKRAFGTTPLKYRKENLKR